MIGNGDRGSSKSVDMGMPRNCILTLLAALTAMMLPAEAADGESLWQVLVPEQRRIQVRHPSQFPRAPVPETPSPPTVSNPRPDVVPSELPLDEAIRTALVNSEVVRVLAGVTATSSGRTIYDAAITNTTIDQERARFDPTRQRYQFVGSHGNAGCRF